MSTFVANYSYKEDYNNFILKTVFVRGFIKNHINSKKFFSRMLLLALEIFDLNLSNKKYKLKSSRPKIYILISNE